MDRKEEYVVSTITAADKDADDKDTKSHDPETTLSSPAVQLEPASLSEPCTQESSAQSPSTEAIKSGDSSDADSVKGILPNPAATVDTDVKQEDKSPGEQTFKDVKSDERKCEVLISSTEGSERESPSDRLKSQDINPVSVTVEENTASISVESEGGDTKGVERVGKSDSSLEDQHNSGKPANIEDSEPLVCEADTERESARESGFKHGHILSGEKAEEVTLNASQTSQVSEQQYTSQDRLDNLSLEQNQTEKAEIAQNKPVACEVFITQQKSVEDSAKHSLETKGLETKVPPGTSKHFENEAVAADVENQTAALPVVNEKAELESDQAEKGEAQNTAEVIDDNPAKWEESGSSSSDEESVLNQATGADEESAGSDLRTRSSLLVQESISKAIAAFSEGAEQEAGVKEIAEQGEGAVAASSDQSLDKNLIDSTDKVITGNPATAVEFVTDSDKRSVTHDSEYEKGELKDRIKKETDVDDLTHDSGVAALSGQQQQNEKQITNVVTLVTQPTGTRLTDSTKDSTQERKSLEGYQESGLEQDTVSQGPPKEQETQTRDQSENQEKSPQQAAASPPGTVTGTALQSTFTPAFVPYPPTTEPKPRVASGSSVLSTTSSDASLTGGRVRRKTHHSISSADHKVIFQSSAAEANPVVEGKGRKASAGELGIMGNGSSSQMEIEEVDPRYAAMSTAAMSQPEEPQKMAQATRSQRSSGVGRSSSGEPLAATSQGMGSRWSMAKTSKFNMEGQVDNIVVISADGFNVQEVSVLEGQVVQFICHQSCPDNASIIQVIHDGEELRPVIGGYQIPLGEHNGTFEQQLNLEGEFKFALTGIRCTPLTVKVRRKSDLQVEVTDDGFVPEIFEIDQGTSIRWSWKQTSVPHTVSEVNYVFDKGCLSRQTSNQSMVATVTGTHRQLFNRAGVYYLKTEGAEPGKTHLCAVCVQSVAREYRVEVLDRCFQPMVLLIEEGDRVWFSWDKFKCKKAHSIYQIEPPSTDRNEDDAYEPAKDGFKWTTASKQGLMSHRFDKVGVYYFSDQNFEEAAEYIGTIIVKPKTREHIVKIQGSGFSPDLLRVTTGERVWWVWNGPAIAEVGEGLLLLEEDKVLNPLSRKNMAPEQTDLYQDLDGSAAKLMTRVGAASVTFTTVGVYTYKVADVGDAFDTCSVIVNPGAKNHTVHITDDGFEPKVITVNCNDCVWWVWQSGKKQHNIMQVSHQGLPIPGGFSSGQARDCPSAFYHRFNSPGVYYFISKSLPQVFGAVVVSTRPLVHEVLVQEAELKPDPVTVQLNDVVAWVFGSPRQFNVCLVESVDQVLDTPEGQKAVLPRRCFARGISQVGMYHFKSKSFQGDKVPNVVEETVLSSVVCDDRCDSTIVTLDKKGFHPDTVYLLKGESLLWSWKETKEDHNIIHVSDPESATPLNMIKGPRAFNSGRPLPDSSFLYTFDDDGSYTVVSQGAPGFSCTINILKEGRRTVEPYITSDKKGGSVQRYTKISLASKTAGAKIHYTLDGTRPSTNSKVYHPDRGITLREPGLQFVRAIALAEGFLQSHIFTSRRFWVLTRGDVDDVPESEASEEEPAVPPQTKTWDWWSCKPTIKGCFTSPGTMEIFWEPPNSAIRKQIKSYQLFLNGVSYCPKFPSSNNSLKLVGLAGGRKYNVVVEVYPTFPKNQVLESNRLHLTCPKVSPSGGPVISLESTSDPQTLSVVWMSIDSPKQPIEGYLVFLNDQQCGPKLVPEAGSNRCKVVVSGCETGIDYQLYVLAVSAGSGETHMSNLLLVQLPLDTSNITLPSPGDRVSDHEVYLEYIEVLEGSGQLPQTDEPKKKKKRTPQRSTGSTGSDSDTETGSEASSLETVSSETGSSQSEMSTDEDEEKASEPRPLEMKSAGAVKLGSARRSDGPQKTPIKKKVVDVESTDGIQKEPTHGSKYRKGGLVADDAESSSESESESDYESDRERPPGGHILYLDATKNQASDTKENIQGHSTGYGDNDTAEPMAIVGHGRKKAKHHHHGKTTALIEVQKAVSLDMGERHDKVSGDVTEKSKLAVSVEPKSLVQVQEGEMVSAAGNGLLPAPSIMATTKGKHAVRIAWELPKKMDPQYKLQLYVVNVVGVRFSSEINSDISYECNLVEKGKQVRGVQHCWNIPSDQQQCVVRGLQPALTYRIYVISNFSTARGNKSCEIQTTSSVLYYTVLGPPKPPKLKVSKADLYQTVIAWENPASPDHSRLSGYQILVDGKPLGGLRNPEIEQMVINNLVPGKTISINVVAVMARAAQESDPSKTIHITCPRRPPPPTISQQPSYKHGCVLLAWDKPRGHPDTADEAITAYSIYVDGQWHGEVKASRMGDQHGYQFFLTDLAPEQSYDVSVKSVAGEKTVDPDAQHVYCLSESFMSNVVPVMAPAAPKSPKLRLEGLHPDGIDVTWQTPQQSGDAYISGYQMLKNGKLYGSIIPPDVNSLRIRDVFLGEKLTLQLIALTEHPVGKVDVARGGSVVGDRDSGISGSTPHHDDRSAEVFVGERYAGCKPGPKLVIHYTGLVCPPEEVWCERVTGHSALIVWSKGEEHQAHFVSPDSYQVTWWPGDRPQDEINSDSTTDDHLLITNLRPTTTYTVVVEARKMEKYTDIDEAASVGDTPEGLNAFILSSKSEHLTVKTASPPDAPRNVGVTATTCNTLRIAWDPPQEHGSEVIAIRVECLSLNTQDPHHVTEDIMPDSTSADITGLREKTDYLVRVVAVTEEYFDRLPDKHRHKKLHAIPKDTLVTQEESQWLPSTSIVAKTAGTEAPTNIRLVQASMTSLVLSWTPPLVYGSNKLLSQIVRWRDVRRIKPTDPEDLIVASHVSLLPTEDTLTISDLVPGSQYQIVIEAAVSIKTSLNPDQNDAGIEKYRRTAHIMSRSQTLWTRAPVEPPKVLVQSYDQNSAVLYWEKPILMSIIGKDDEGNPRYLRRYLEGYRLEINGKLQSCLGPQAQTCTLTKCKAGKQYSVVLVAMTCTEDRRRERKEKFKGYFKTTAPQDTDYVGLLDDDLLDQAPSDPVEITLPKSQDGFLESCRTNFIHQEERDNRTFGDIEVAWTIQGQANLLKQFSIVWFSSDDRVIQTKYVGPEKQRTTIPVTHIKSIYTITVEPCYYTEVLPQRPQDVHTMIPGPPDAPEIFLRSQDKEEFVIEWGEPRCYGGVTVKGYQVYMNDRKVGNELNSSHRKAVIPCRSNKLYRINLVALSSSPDYQDSPKSNTLVINIGKGPVTSGPGGAEECPSDDHDLPLKVTCVMETGIHLDWSAFVENTEVAYYKIQWSSVAQPAQREVRLSPKDSSCVINKCLPGTTHFVRLVAYSEDGTILEKSRQLTVQTSAPPDSPILSVRACNFRYIAIQWEKPTTYGDAAITGYKVYVNGIVESVLGADCQSYTFTQGKWCQEYSFQVQALTGADNLNSKPSEPLIVTWPGTKAPQIRRIPSVSSSSLRVTWSAPYLTEGIKIKHYKLCCVEEDTEKMVQSIGPIHPDTCEAEFKHLKKGGYMVFLETHLYGTGEVVRSEPIRMQPSVCPDPPQISVTVVGLEERRQLDKLTCDLANKRDRLIRTMGHKLKRIGALTHPLRAEKDEEVVMGAHTLTGVEDLLEACFMALENYTGQLIAHVSWQCPQSNEDVHLSGFKVLVDGKQYGSSMHAGVRTVRLQLALDQPSYSLSMVALSDKPQGSSVESSVAEILTTPFRPFAYYCYHSVHNKSSKWPAQGCCKYQDSLTYERQVGKKLANQGLLNKHVPPPACSLLDVFAGDYKPLMTSHQPNCPTLLLFWTPWCMSSSKIMDHYIRFARETSKEFNFIAVMCGVSGISTDDRQSLVHLVTSNGWREDGVVWHVTSECASNIYRTLSTINHASAGTRVDQDLLSEKYMDLTELLGIAGVPTFLFIHPEGYIAWHGRYSAFDYASFSAFMRHTNSEVMRHPCPVFSCDSCKNDMTIDHDSVRALLPDKLRQAAQASALRPATNTSEVNLHSVAASSNDLKYAAIDGYTESAGGTDRLFMVRKPSPKRRPKLSINQRPYSASATPQQLQGSPYLAKVVPMTSPPTRSRNRPVSAKLTHYV